MATTIFWTLTKIRARLADLKVEEAKILGESTAIFWQTERTDGASAERLRSVRRELFFLSDQEAWQLANPTLQRI